MKTVVLTVFAAMLTGPQLFADISVSLTSPTSTIQIGDTLNFTAAANDSNNPQQQFTYQFSVQPSGAGSYAVLKDFYYSNTFAWTPSDQEGMYDIAVTVHSASGETASAVQTVNVNSRAAGGKPVVSATNNSLVALYSAPPCSAPSQVRVHFGPQGALNNHEFFTPFKPCSGLSVNFEIGGMASSANYVMQQELFDGVSVTPGPQLTWTTGALPAAADIPSHVALQGPAAPTSVNYPMLLRSSLYSIPFATDLNENVVWYAGWYQPTDTGYLVNFLPGGYFLAVQDDPVNSAAICPAGSSGLCGDHQYFSEFDMAGNTVRQTNFTAVQAQLNAVRATENKPAVRLIQFSHEGIQLPNGGFATMATNEQIKDQGAGPVDVLGDTIVVLDSNLQAVWHWDAFDFLDVTRFPRVSPYACIAAVPGCPPKFFNIDPSTGQPYLAAVDWTHSNSISYDSSDGNLIVSFRNQSWVIKIAYENGAGDGHLVWTLGYGGTFQLASGYPVTDWFSGQHDARFQANGLLSLFDDNNPSAASSQPGGNSHGQAWQLDTTNMVATPVVNFDLGSSSLALGSAVLLSNGNYEFNSGYIDNRYGQTTEFTPSGDLVYKEQTDARLYRTFRLRDLYTPSN